MYKTHKEKTTKHNLGIRTVTDGEDYHMLQMTNFKNLDLTFQDVQMEGYISENCYFFFCNTDNQKNKLQLIFLGLKLTK